MIQLEANGVPYSNFDDIEVITSLDNVSGGFSFTAYSDSVNSFPIKQDDVCRVLVDGTPVLTGRVEIITVGYDNDSHSITIQGRSKTADIIDSTVGDGVDFNAPITLIKLIEQILVKANITDIKVIDDVETIDPFTETEKISSHVGETVFSLMESYCRKRQVLITTNGVGDIVLTRASGQLEAFTLINKSNTPQRSNIKRASVTYDNTNRFNKYIIKSQGNVSGLGLAGLISAEQIVDQSGNAVDNDIRTARILYLLAEKSSTPEQCEERAVWQANINRARSFNYEVTAQGHTNVNTGNVWEFNKLISVDDDFAGVHGQFLVNSVSYRVALSEGSTVTLGIVTRDAYTLEPSTPATQKSTNLLGQI